MSSSVSTEEDQQVFNTICCTVSATALLVYEYLITFDREYQLVWKRRFSAATLVFLLARYCLLVQFIILLLTIYPLSTTACSALIWSMTAFEVSFLLLMAAFSSLRVYILSGRRQWEIASLILILSLVPLGISLFANVRQVVVVAPPPINCTSVIMVSPELNKILLYIARATVITANVLINVVTIHQTYWQRRVAVKANLRTPLHTLILRDGTAYFLVLLVMNIADIIFLYLGETFQDSTYISAFIDPITAILISRFMFNLREVDASQCGTEDSSHHSFDHSIRFANFVEPLGASLDHELSLSAIDPSSLDEQQVDEAGGHKHALGKDEEMESERSSISGSCEAEPGPSGFSYWD